MTIPAQTCPPSFRPHEHEYVTVVNRPWTAVWAWLMRPETFTKGPLWPYRVEFIDTPQADGTVSRGFEVGTLNAHHGPFLNFCGVISRIEERPSGAVRDLEYSYGAYALAFRLIRPHLLRISVDAVEETQCRVTVHVGAYVRRGMSGLWTFAQRCFWPGFGVALRRSVPAD